MPADIVNLNKARKAKTRRDGKTRAEQNRAKFGQSEAEKQKEILSRSQRDKRLDGAKRDDAGDGETATSDDRGSPGKKP